MPTERLGTEKESSPVDQPAPPQATGTDTNGYERQQDSRQSMAALPDRSASNAGIRSRLSKFNRKRPDDSEKKVSLY